LYLCGCCDGQYTYDRRANKANWSSGCARAGSRRYKEKAPAAAPGGGPTAGGRPGGSADARAQAERAALATDSLDNYPDEDGKKYLQIELDDLEGVAGRWEERHALDETEAGAYESAWWQRTENQREHGIVRMAQYHLERLAGKPLYQCPWSKMRLIGSRRGPTERW
jgi:hypothetical protein